MQRDLLNNLKAWKAAHEHAPLLVRGARQVGKSYLIKEFIKQDFSTSLTINFEKEEQYKLAFENLDPHMILNRLYLQSGTMLKGETSLLFLDEIQECPQALEALRYFKEEMPELHVVGAGSLLEFVINSDEISMPVGRVETLFLMPLSFYEYLTASGLNHLRTYLGEVDLTTGIDPIVHEKLCEQLQEYFFLGGMPAVVSEYLSTKNLERVQAKQLSLLQALRDDFGKYATKTKHRYMQQILKRAPGIIGERFYYSKIDPDMGSREIKEALGYLVDACLLHKINHTNASGLPLNSQLNEKIFKTIFLDIGLANSQSYLSHEILLQKDLMLLNRGMLAEQFVGQELLAHRSPYMESQLYYWDRESRSSSAEVDYVINVDDRIIPIEVKAGKTGSLRSLQLFLDEKSCAFGVRLSLKPLSFNNRVLSIPLYMIAELPRIVRMLQTK